MSSGSQRLSPLLVLAFLGACASGREAPTELRSQSGVRPADGAKDLPANDGAAPSPGPTPAAEPSAERRGDATLIVIEEAAEPRAVTPQDLVEASRQERERRARAGKAAVVITDKNLAQHARNGRVTTGTAPKPTPSAPAPSATSDDSESRWRSRMRGLRQALHDAVDRLPALEREAADQRIRFYSEDDPYVRDGRIKPAWDRALELVERCRKEVEEGRFAIAVALDEGRREGAEPGWLMEGLDLEPPEQPKRTSAGPSEPHTGAEPREPNVIEEPPS